MSDCCGGDIDDKQDSSAGPDIDPMPPADAVDGAITPSRDAKRCGIWIIGLTIGFEDPNRTQKVNKNIGDAISNYLQGCARQRVLMTAKFGTNVQLAKENELLVLHDISKIVKVMKFRVDIVDEKWLRKAFPPMNVGDVASWFKTFVHNFGNNYEVIPIVNMKNGK